MKIQAQEIRFDGEKSYKVVGFEKCCDSILNHDSVDLNKACCELLGKVGYSVKLVETTVDYDYYESDTDIDYLYSKIDYCPFCQEKIEVEIVDIVDLSDRYFSLKNNRKDLWEKHNKTDSIKKQSELKQQVRELDDKIDEFYNSDGFDKCISTVMEE